MGTYRWWLVHQDRGHDAAAAAVVRRRLAADARVILTRRGQGPAGGQAHGAGVELDLRWGHDDRDFHLGCLALDARSEGCALVQLALAVVWGTAGGLGREKAPLPAPAAPIALHVMSWAQASLAGLYRRVERQRVGENVRLYQTVLRYDLTTNKTCKVLQPLTDFTVALPGAAALPRDRAELSNLFDR